MPDPVRITFLGGLGEIGRNCACLEQEARLLLLDCGLMFPDVDMPGVDLVLPDFTWLRENADRLEGCLLTHGHEDHVGALSYLLREISFPVYGSPLTLGLARNRIEEGGLLDRTELIPVVDGERRQVGPFDFEVIPVTHSVPHGFATAFHTPQGVILHSGDFKLDLTPVDGRVTDLGRIGAIAHQHGIRLLLADSTNAEEPGHTKSERSVGRVLRDLFMAHTGKRIVTACFASHLHRIQQIADAAIMTGRVVATLGRSMGKNVALAREMGLFFIPVHGEFRHLTHHARLAIEMGVTTENVLLAEDGDVVELSDRGIDFCEEIPAGFLYVDGIVGDVGHGVLRDRRVLSEEGVVVVVVTVDAQSGEVLTGPEIITRGWVHAPEAEALLEEARQRVVESLEKAADEGAIDIETLKRIGR